MSMDLKAAAKTLAALDHDKAERAAQARKRAHIDWAASQVGTKVRAGERRYQCPDCKVWVPNMGILRMDHGWDLIEGRWPMTVGCSAQLREKRVSFPRFTASPDAIGCGPLQSPWTTAKRFYVMEEHIYLRDVLVPWSRKWEPTTGMRDWPEGLMP